MQRVTRTASVWALGVALAVQPAWPDFDSFLEGPAGLAHAQEGDSEGDGDSDSDGDGDDGDDGGGFGGFGGSGGGERSGAVQRGSGPAPEILRRPLRTLRSLFDRGERPDPPRRTVRRPAPQPEPLPERAERELTALGLDDAEIATLEGQGYAVDARTLIEMLDSELVRLIVPDGVSLDEARAAVVALDAGSAVDFNHYYRPEERPAAPCEGMHCEAMELIDWHFSDEAETCVAPSLIGLIDTGINPDHETFTNGSLRIVERFGEGDQLSDLKHGTAVAALLVGSGEGRTSGLLPGAELLAVDAFLDAGTDTRATAYDLVRAIDMLASEEVAVLNLSLAGPANELLERAVAQAAQEGVILVAAAGNNGPNADPAYPAAYDGVIAVTAVDRNMRPYRRAGQGAHVDVAAPGVDVWTAASISGARPKTGTSFAAPFVTAAAALATAMDSSLNGDQMQRFLAETARDLGEPGKDSVFGWGLLDAAKLCATVEAALAREPESSVADTDTEAETETAGTEAEGDVLIEPAEAGTLSLTPGE
ncbi:S8 family serine peptidase [Pararhizobium haloflavum]|uniref:S8 family serine peptidase n=1 Tax=Pararhizobium haloflavum TaxID=2037914 RepID=UPI000C19E67B|nr:S8 family serine peptidase [Pararhizobium haloflavum]